MSSKKVVAQLQGGLGNQLFTLFAAAHLAQVTKSKLVVDRSEVSHGFSDRDYELESIEFPFQFQEIRRSALIPFKIRNRFRWNSYKYLKFFSKRYYISQLIGRDPNFEQLKSPRILRGYFQTHQYVNSLNFPQSKSLLSLKHPSDKFVALQDEIKAVRPIVIHVRRGDYLKLSESFGMLSELYFTEGIRRLRELGNDSPVWIFTDSVEPISESFVSNFAIREIGPNSGLTSSETLVLMSLNSGIVISNSSFSWWAAYLSGPDKPVIAPDKWFRNLEDPTQLLPDHWIKIQSMWI